jgi:hypothetical protein
MGIEVKNHLRSLIAEDLSKAQARREPAPAPSIKNGNPLHALAKQAGFFQRRRAEKKAGQEAAVHFSALRVAGVRAEAEVATAALTVGKAQIMAAVIAPAVTQLGAQLLDLNVRGSATQLRLSSASTAEQMSHLRNRGEAIESLKAMASEGNITPDETAVLVELAHGDSLDDIRRSRRRNQRTKDVIDLLHGIALDSVVGAEKPNAN